MLEARVGVPTYFVVVAWNRRRFRGGNMEIGKISVPKHWEDWVSLALGIWLCASPWVLGFAADMTATQNAFLVGALLIVIEIVTIGAFRPWEEWANIALGAWLIVSPWLLGAAALAAANFVVVGIAVLLLALYELWDIRRGSPRPA
jgi:hypothetical protein